MSPDKDQPLQRIGMLWIGGPLSFLEQVCILSFLDVGHPVVFYTYGDVPNIPAGVRVVDARTVLEAPPFLRHERTGSLSLHADLFRLRMLQQDDTLIWADTDAYCLRPWYPVDGYYVGRESETSIASGVIALPKSSLTLQRMLASTQNPYPIPEWFRPRQKRALRIARRQGAPVHVSAMPWGVWGPRSLTYYLNETGEVSHTLAPEILYPISFAERWTMLAADGPRLKDFGPETTSVHLYGSRMRRMLTRKFDGVPPKNSLIGELLLRHGLFAEDARLPAENTPNPDKPMIPAAKAAPVPAEPRSPDAEKTFGSALIVTCMKDEGAFLLEWIAYHQVVGFDHFLIYTNDCTDGTDKMVRRLQELGIASHRDNSRRPHQRASYQLRAFSKALKDDVYRAHKWAMILDADEYLNIHVGQKRLQHLIDETPDAHAISVTWRLFGTAGIDDLERGCVTEKLTRAAPQFCPRPAQAWGIKTLFRTSHWEKLGAHRPRLPKDGVWDSIHWVNGSGKRMPEAYQSMTRGNWRSRHDSIGYDFAQVNHYALRSRRTFLLKSLKGVVHGGIDRDLDYWQRMEHNEEEDHSIAPLLPEMKKRYDYLLMDPTLGKLHNEAWDWHEGKVQEALNHPEVRKFYDNLNPK